MKRLVCFTGLAWAIAQTAYAVQSPNSNLRVTGELRPIVLTVNSANSSSNPFTIADSTTPNVANVASGASTASSTSSKRTTVAAPPASSRPGTVTTPRVPTLLSSLSPVLTSLQRGSVPNVLRRINYEPTPVNNRNPGTPAGLQPFDPTPSGPGTAPHSSSSVPDGGATMSLLGIGFLGTALMKRKFAK
jgi:hypothetical protein